MTTCNVETCEAPTHAKGYCKLHYTRWSRTGDPTKAHRMQPRSRPLAERIADLTDRSAGPDACWPWTGTRYGNNYGVMQYRNVVKQAHVWAYQSATGEVVPDGMFVLHSCDNPPCCNPAHLRVGTHQANMDDKVSRDRQSRLPGEAHPSHRLSDADVLEIRRSGAAGVTQRVLAERFGVSPSLICLILNGKRWTHLEVVSPDAIGVHIEDGVVA